MQSSHHNNFDFLRLAAAIMVWYGHCCNLTNHPDPMLSLPIEIETMGGMGVKIFFIISGYFITMSYENSRNIFHYTKNRALRILPALFAIVLISVCIMGPVMTTLSLPGYFKDPVTWRYLRCLLIFPIQYDLPGVFRDNPVQAVNGSLWTLQHEVRLYAAIALLGFLGILRPRLMFFLLLGLCAIQLYGIIIMPGKGERVLTLQWGKLNLMVRLATQFALGSFLYLARDRLPLRFGHALLAAGSAATLIVIAHMAATHLIDTALFDNLVFDIAFAYILIYLGFLKLPMLPSVSRWGDFSYGFYLYAYPVQQICLVCLGRHPDFTLFLITSFTGTFLCAVLSWRFIEKPALALK